MTIARTSRGPCDQCDKPIVKGDNYENRVRYARTGEESTPGLAGGRRAVAVHLDCVTCWSEDLSARAKKAYQER